MSVHGRVCGEILRANLEARKGLRKGLVSGPQTTIYARWGEVQSSVIFYTLCLEYW